VINIFLVMYTRFLQNFKWEFLKILKFFRPFNLAEIYEHV
jgi:hypothetical protein